MYLIDAPHVNNICIQTKIEQHTKTFSFSCVVSNGNFFFLRFYVSLLYTYIRSCSTNDLFFCVGTMNCNSFRLLACCRFSLSFPFQHVKIGCFFFSLYFELFLPFCFVFFYAFVFFNSFVGLQFLLSFFLSVFALFLVLCNWCDF